MANFLASPWMELILFAARKLAEQYRGNPDHQHFERLIAAVEELRTKEGTPDETKPAPSPSPRRDPSDRSHRG
jgi:hypothetical protein